MCPLIIRGPVADQTRLPLAPGPAGRSARGARPRCHRRPATPPCSVPPRPPWCAAAHPGALGAVCPWLPCGGGHRRPATPPLRCTVAQPGAVGAVLSWPRVKQLPTESTDTPPPALRDHSPPASPYAPYCQGPTVCVIYPVSLVESQRQGQEGHAGRRAGVQRSRVETPRDRLLALKACCRRRPRLRDRCLQQPAAPPAAAGSSSCVPTPQTPPPPSSRSFAPSASAAAAAAERLTNRRALGLLYE